VALCHGGVPEYGNGRPVEPAAAEGIPARRTHRTALCGDSTHPDPVRHAGSATAHEVLMRRGARYEAKRFLSVRTVGPKLNVTSMNGTTATGAPK